MGNGQPDEDEEIDEEKVVKRGRKVVLRYH